MNESPAGNLVDRVLEEVTHPLRKTGIRYMLIGALAVMAHGAPRMTQDLDLRVELSSLNRNQLREVLESTGYTVEGPVRNEFGERFLLDHPDFLVEIYLASDHPYSQEEFKHAISVRFGQTEHLVIGMEDLVLRKMYNMRIRRSAFDQQDVLALLHMHKAKMNVDYIRERARLFRLQERFESLWSSVNK